MSGVRTRVHLDLSDGLIHFERLQDVEPILDNNKRLQNEPQRPGDLKHVASIPNVVLEKWCNEDGVNIFAFGQAEFARYVTKKLNDPDWRYLKTTDGRV